MQQTRLFGFTDDAGHMALARTGHTLSGHMINIVSGGVLHALVAPEPASWPWDDAARASLHKLTHYHRILAMAAAELPKIIPASFESVFDNKEAVDHVLAQHQRPILDLMTRYGALRQFALSIRWDTAHMEHLLQRATPNRATSLEQERRLLRDQILLQLQGKLQDIIIMESNDHGLVLQALLLTKKSDETRLVHTLETFDRECHGRLDMRLTGPLPACNFARVDVKLPDATFVKRACRDLGISHKARLIDIKTAYRRKAKHAHPDYANHEGGGQDVMVRLTQSYRYLTKLAAQQHSNDDVPSSLPADQQWLRFDRAGLRKTPLMYVQRGITRWDSAYLQRGQNM